MNHKNRPCKCLNALILFVLLVGFCLLSTSPLPVFGQKKVLKLEKAASGKIKTIKENSRVMVRLQQGEKVKGRFKIIDDSTLMLKGAEISLHEITHLKRNRLMRRVLGDALIFYGFGIIAGDLIMYPFIGDIYFVYTAVGATVVATGILINTLPPRHKQKNGWNYSIVPAER